MANSGDSLWLFVLNSPDAFNAGNIDGTCMAFFDDDYVGPGADASAWNRHSNHRPVKLH